MTENTVFRATKQLPKPLGISVRRPGVLGSSSIYDPSRARNPTSTQSEAPRTSPGTNKEWGSGQANPGGFNTRRIPSNTGNRMGSIAAGTKNTTPANNFGPGMQNLGSTQSNRTDVTINALRKDESKT